MQSRRVTLLPMAVLLGLASAACSAQSSPIGGEARGHSTASGTASSSEPPTTTTDDGQPGQGTKVAPDLHRLADRFVAYAVGDSASFPHWESVSMSIGGEGVKSIDDFGAALSNRDIWRMCPGDWDGYAAASCPVDFLGPIRAAEVNGMPLVYAPDYSDVTCAPPRTGPLPEGRTVVVRPTLEGRTCATDFALALVADDHGLLRAIDLTLSAP